MFVKQHETHFEIYGTALSTCTVCHEEVEIGATESFGYCPQCKKARLMTNPLFRSREVINDSEKIYGVGRGISKENV